MMTMRKALYMLLMLSALSVWSCHKEVGPDEAVSGTGSIELRLDSGKAISLLTKATDLEEGLKFDNLLVILVNNSGNVVGNVYRTESSVTQDVVSFDGLLPGNYHVYAYANIDADAWQNSGGDLISAQEKLLTAGTPFASFVDRELAALTDTDVPSNPSTSMLLTGHKEIPVGLTRVSETLDLLRPVVRFRVIIRNHTQFPVGVRDLRFSKFNPDRTYLLDHSDASGVPSIPSGVTYRSMPAFDTAAGDNDSVSEDSEAVIYQRLIYENVYSGVYKVFATLALDRSSESMSSLELSLGDNPFGVIDYTTLIEMDEGEEVDVLVTNPQINPRSGRIFTHISADNHMAWESAGYSSYNDYLTRALAIYNESPYTYSEYTNPNTQGYAAWDGISATPQETNTFDYSGKRAQYFHTLSKSGGQFTLSGLGVNNKAKNGTVTGNSITGIRIESGTVTSGKNPADVAGKLVRFKSSTGQYIQSNTNYDANVAKQKESNFLWQNGGTHQDRQLMLFGKYLTGGALKRILKDNNKEVPLTYMARNEEINVVINVYYSDQEGTLEFEVDNSTWKNATTSSYTFN